MIYKKLENYVRITRDKKQVFFGTSRDAAKFLGCSVSSITRAYKAYNGVLKKYNCFIKLCNDYPIDRQKDQQEYGLKKVGENPLNGSAQPLSNKGEDIV